MAQLRQDFDQFAARDAVILVVGPEDADSFAYHWQQQKYPFIGLPDLTGAVSGRYGQEIKLLKGGRMPAMMVLDKQGVIQYAHYGDSMRDIPANKDVLRLLDKFQKAAIQNSGI